MLQKAIQWIHCNHLDGHSIPITHRQRRPYPEVTGYYIPTLLSIGEIKLAEQFARWLVAKQNPNGSFSLDTPSISYVFDTGQVIRGWISILDRLPELAEPLQRACDWIIQSSDSSTGRFVCPPPGGDWCLGPRGEVNEGIHLYVLKPMQEAARLLEKNYIKQAADRALSYYLKNCNLTDFTRANALTHFYAYIQEALFELGCMNELAQGMSSVARFQQENGVVPAYHDVNWICSPGLAQLAKVWYLMNDISRADKAIEFLAQLQNQSGGFYGSYGVNADYFPADEISWAVKYVIEAEQLHIARHFDRTVDQYSQSISSSDERVQVILSEVKNATSVLDAGCGKGRYAALIKHEFPHIDVHAADVSEEMLRHVPNNIKTKKASIQDLPYASKSFDVVYCVEALEHVPNPESAIQEMVRILRPGGKLIIIDKNIKHQGTLQIEKWEQWFDVEKLTQLMSKFSLKTQSKFISYDNHPADGLFVAWIGTKENERNNINFYRENYVDELNRQIVEACQREDKVWLKEYFNKIDAKHQEHFHEEFSEHRFGMQVIQQLLQATYAQFDIVDVGCGNAMLLRQLRKDNHRVQGVEISHERVVKNNDVTMREGFFEELPLDGQSVDIVIALNVLEHVYNLDKSFRESMRVLREGGALICQVALENVGDNSHHVRLFNLEKLQNSVKNSGYELIHSSKIPYLINQFPQNIFLIAKKPGKIGAGDLLKVVLENANAVLKNATENA